MYLDYAAKIPDNVKVYIATSVEGTQLSNRLRFDFGDTTDMTDLESDIQSPSLIFDLSGCRVENPMKGVYIMNGRKVVIK